ncbi:hypothetical protein JKG47_11810 [Acidithiobacillus sp. MC6.1]|nr:hypothetical protein [Acidithiobacillus sp. MC6.1]
METDGGRFRRRVLSAMGWHPARASGEIVNTKNLWRVVGTMQAADLQAADLQAAALEIMGYAVAIFFAETLVKIWIHG